MTDLFLVRFRTVRYDRKTFEQIKTQILKCFPFLSENDPVGIAVFFCTISCTITDEQIPWGEGP